MVKICPICGKEHERIRSLFCCEDCHLASTREKRKADKKRYYENNKERMNSKHIEWIDTNREKWNTYIKEYRKAKIEKEN